MKKSFQLKNLLVSLAIASTATLALTPATTQAGEVSYNAAVSNMYLWRGQDVSNGQAVVSGGVDYATDAGFGVGAWASSEDDGTEFDLYATYGFEKGDFGMTVGYWAYLYPSDGTTSSFDKDEGTYLSEYEVTLSYSDFSATAMIDTNDTDLRYYSLGYDIGKVSLHAGLYDQTGDTDYTDYSISYAATDALSITVSKAQGDGIVDAKEKPMIAISYSLPI